MPIPVVGIPAPDFELRDDRGVWVRLSHYLGKKVVLYFYPKADTPGCTAEACGFRDEYSVYAQKGAAILGVSPDGVEAQEKFKRKYHLPFPLLADVGHKVSDTYGVWGLKKSGGIGVRRTTFVIDEQGRIARVFEGVKPNGHSLEVLEALEASKTPTSKL
jgi:peroxiredoxin Q/BCP